MSVPPGFDPDMVMLDPRYVLCDRHREPFREDWPRGAALMMSAMLEEAVRNHDILRACGWDGSSDGTADSKMLGRAIREFSPICCLIGDERTAEWTSLALTPGAGEDFLAMLEQLRATSP